MRAVKGLEKLTFIRLAEVLSQKQVVANDAITDALYTQDQNGEPFPDVLVSNGCISEWDLAKVVVEHFQLPFLMAGHHQLGDEAKVKIPVQKLFEHMLVPLDLFGNVLTVSMPILAPFETMDQLQREFDVELFPYVGLLSENKKLLGDNFEGFTEFWEKHSQERSKRQNMPQQHRRKGGAGDDWMNIFDTGDAAVLDSIGGKKKD